MTREEQDLYFAEKIIIEEQAYSRGYEDAKKEFDRPHGEWIFKNGKYRCTACGEKAIYVYPGLSTIPKAILTDFCPNCGADMRGEAE